LRQVICEIASKLAIAYKLRKTWILMSLMSNMTIDVIMISTISSQR